MAAIPKRSRKKQLRSDVRRYARLVLEKYYEEEKQPRRKDTINKMVKEVSKRVVRPILDDLALEKDRPVSARAAEHE